MNPQNILNAITLWFVYWLGMMGVFIYILKPLGVNHLDHFYLTILFYLTTAYWGAKLFDFNLQDLTPKLKMNIVKSFIIFWGLSFLCSFIPIDAIKVDYLLKMEFYYPLLRWQSTFSKSSELIFQQALIAAYLYKAKNLGINKKQNIRKFTLMFFILHLPLFMVFGLSALIFIIPSMVAGYFFAWLILNREKGLLYSLILHQGYYLLGSVIYRIIIF